MSETLELKGALRGISSAVGSDGMTTKKATFVIFGDIRLLHDFLEKPLRLKLETEQIVFGGHVGVAADGTLFDRKTGEQIQKGKNQKKGGDK
jgi:hypothetical protein